MLKPPENTLNSRKLVSFPLIAHYLSAGPPLPHTPPFTGRPGHTHTYSSFLLSAPSKPVVLLAALTCYLCFALKALKLPVFSYELTLLTFSVSYLWIISYIYIYIYIRSAFYVFSVRKGGGGAVNFGSLFSFIIDIFCVFSDNVDIFG